MSVKSVKWYAVLVLLCVLLVYLVDLTTFRYHGRGISGNGNPGLLFLFPAWTAALMLMIATFIMAVKYFDDLSDHIVKKAYRIWLPLFSLLALLLSVYFQYRKIMQWVDTYRQMTEKAGSPLFLGALNPYNNSLYYNAHILLFCVSAVMLCGWWVVSRRPY
ncbi:hypothetical protein [Paenibacillus favisporus]|uniref:hypothetical protein n=1 Tax=Paenibacillus favisporus TaxID=221028 RepID=UPI0013D23D17|nr:hypothetical protein [Paenibacillus favisporus]